MAEIDLMIIKAFPLRLLRSNCTYKQFQKVLKEGKAPFVAHSPCAPARGVHGHGTG